MLRNCPARAEPSETIAPFCLPSEPSSRLNLRQPWQTPPNFSAWTKNDLGGLWSSGYSGERLPRAKLGNLLFPEAGRRIHDVLS